MFSTETLILPVVIFKFFKDFLIVVISNRIPIRLKWQIVVTVNFETKNINLKLVTIVSLFKFNGKSNKMKKILFLTAIALVLFSCKTLQSLIQN
jgi:hypothetical protein